MTYNPLYALAKAPKKAKNKRTRKSGDGIESGALPRVTPYMVVAPTYDFAPPSTDVGTTLTGHLTRALRADIRLYGAKDLTVVHDMTVAKHKWARKENKKLRAREAKELASYGWRTKFKWQGYKV